MKGRGVEIKEVVGKMKKAKKMKEEVGKMKEEG